MAEQYPDLRIIDANGNQQTLAWLNARYPGCYVLRSPLWSQPDSMIAGLIEVRETKGPAVIQATILNADGSPVSDLPVALSWPNPEKVVATPGALTDLSGNPFSYGAIGAVQKTDVNGTTGFGFGGGSIIKDGKGPHGCWIASKYCYSDGWMDFGWLAGSDHWGPLRVTFQLFITGPAPDPDPDPDPGPGGPILIEFSISGTIRVTRSPEG